MKKIILTLLAVVSMGFAAMAGTLGSRAMFQGCLLYTSDNVRVDFNFGGQSVTGTLMWPTQEGLKLYFDGSLLNRVL